jgi:hypothetical protein
MAKRLDSRYRPGRRDRINDQAPLLLVPRAGGRRGAPGRRASCEAPVRSADRRLRRRLVTTRLVLEPLRRLADSDAAHPQLAATSA